MNPIEEFTSERKQRIASYSNDTEFKELSNKWLELSMRRKYVYNFEWMGRPVIQNPADLMVVQELIWKIQPDTIIETGIAHGGSIIFHASMMALNTFAGGPKNFKVIGVDIDIREHNKQEILKNPLSEHISLIQGSSIETSTVEQVKKATEGSKKIMVFLDSNHTHDHVTQELKLYSPFVSTNSYCIVFDTFVENMPDDLFPDRPWSRGNNPLTAVQEFLKENRNFETDRELDNKVLVSSAPGGFLKRIK